MTSLFDDAVERGSLDASEVGPPPLVRTTMDEVRLATGTNGRTCVGSFSGCGGSSVGMRMAGWSVPVAIEFIPEAAKTYRANSGSTLVIQSDIRKVKAEEILEWLELKPGELDCFEGSPPCASFSSAGMRERGWGTVKKYSETEQRTDDLFGEWLRLLEGLNPRSFVAENVPGMTSGAALEEYAHVVTRGLSQLGYHVQAEILNAANFGVPQERRRLIFVGFRRDLDLALPTRFFPSPTSAEPHTLRQALESVDPEDPDHAPFLAECSMEGKAVGRTWEWKKGLRDKDLCARCEMPLADHTYRTVTVGSVRKTKEDAGAQRDKQVAICADGAKGIEVKDYFLLTVPELDEPCSTLTATGAQVGAASVVHPTECRKFTPAEAKAICGFPVDFILTGTREQRYERMGRAVAPPLYAAVGGLIAEVLDG